MNELVIDASNIVGGGGLTHLKELIENAKPLNHGFSKVILWASDDVLDEFDNKSWLSKRSHLLLNGRYLYRFLWKYLVLKPSLSENTLIFMPGGGYMSGVSKVVTMCQNLLPLDIRERNRYFFSWQWIRLRLLHYLHNQAYSKAEGVIFLNNYSWSALSKAIQDKVKSHSIIPHGINKAFFSKKESYKIENKFTLLYVSSICLYKHQWVLAEAVFRLREKGYENIELILIGKPKKYGIKKLNKLLSQNKDNANAVEYLGIVPYKELSKYYQKADAFVYPSTCETFGMTLLEAMANSLPIACSNKSSMSELLKDGSIYYEPESVEDTMNAILKLYNDKKLRKEKGERAYEIAQSYSWPETAQKTFSYLRSVADS